MKKRPGVLTALCLFVGVGNIAMLAFAGRTNWAALGFPGWWSGYSAACAIANLFGGYGIWRMKRWGLLLTGGLLLAAQAVLVAVHHWTIGSLLIGLIEVGIIARYWRSLE